MQLQHTWEHNLLDLATEALHLSDEQPSVAMTFEEALLKNAEARIEKIRLGADAKGAGVEKLDG